MCDAADHGTGSTRKRGSHRSTGNEPPREQTPEELDRSGRWANDLPDEDFLDDLRRDYGSGDRTEAYWEGYNAVRNEPEKPLILPPKKYGKGSQERKEFLDGINDARHKLKGE